MKKGEVKIEEVKNTNDQLILKSSDIMHICVLQYCQVNICS